MMNFMPRTPSARRPARSAGQSVYEVMLILACAAMALAVFFAAYEYLSYYHGPSQPESAPAVAPRPQPRAPAPAVSPAPAPTAAPAPAPTAAPAPATSATPETTAAPAATTP
jgi:hypothetical protein